MQKIIRSHTGSQWRGFSMGVMSVLRDEKVAIRAAVFWSFWRRASCVLGSWYSKKLHKSKREEIRAWTSFSVAEQVKCLQIKLKHQSWKYSLWLLRPWLLHCAEMSGYDKWARCIAEIGHQLRGWCDHNGSPSTQHQALLTHPVLLFCHTPCFTVPA